MYLNKTEILKQVSVILQNYRPINIQKKNRSKYAVGELKGTSKEVLVTMHKTWCLNNLISSLKLNNQLINPSKYTQQWIGKKLRIEISAKSKISPRQREIDSNQALKVKVNRYLKNSNALIRNVEIGIFPSTAIQPAIERWTPAQLLRKEAAFANGLWKSPESNAKNLIMLIS
jgi:hypothetical protein